MELTGGVLNTQFYDKVDDYKTLEHNRKIADKKHTKKKLQISTKYYLVLKPLHQNITTY